MMNFDNNADLQDSLRNYGYLSEANLAAIVRLALRMRRPLLLEGPAGVGKTALAQAIAGVLERELTRLQCYEGVDSTQALYDWNYHKQLTDLQRSPDTKIFTEEYLLPRPLMKSLMSEQGTVLLIDEIDRADVAFEALLLEFLADFQVSVPEWKTVKAAVPPVVILTSNRSRPLSDALRRRCLYQFLDWPDAEREAEIVFAHTPELQLEDVRQIVSLVQTLRSWDLMKLPGIAESIDWATAYAHIQPPVLSVQWARETLGCVIKDVSDWEVVLSNLPKLLEGV